MRWFSSAAVVATVIALALCASAFAQTSQGITGLVTDATGAVIPNAKVTVHNESTGLDSTVVTTATGNYSVPFLHPGVYDVHAAAANFKPVDKRAITLQTDQTVKVDFALSPGSVTQQVTVDASADVLDYSKPDRGDVVELTRVEQLPILAGDPFNIADLSAGVVNNLAVTNYNPYNQTAQSLGIHGSGVELNIDGTTDLSMTGAQNYAYDPPNDAVQEFKITTNAYDAAAGRSPGGAIDLTLKSGGQKLHGDAYEIMRRGFLDANSSTNDAHRVISGHLPQYNVPAHTQDYYGFELDGPVIAPRIWGRNKKTFFMLAYQEIKNLSGGAANGSVPTQAMIGNGSQYPGLGDFSALLTANGATYNQPIYDPLSEAACTANNTDNGSYSSKNPHVCRYQFGYGPGAAPGPQGNPVQIGPANVIPASRMSPTAMAILSWYAYPNQAPSPTTANDFNNNYGQNNPTTALERNYLLKLDQNIGDNDTVNLAVRLWTEFGTSINGSPRNNVNPAHPGINWAGYGAHYTSHYKDPSVVLGWTHTFSPRLINSVKASLLITDQTDNTGPASGFNPTNLGFSASLAQANSSYFNRFPSVTPGNYNVLGSIPGLERGDNELAVLDVVNYTHGNHVIHFGADLRPGQYAQRISNASGNGVNLSVGKGWTQQWDTVVTGGATGISTPAGYSGNSIASMLLGTWDSGNATTQPENFYSFHYFAGFFQDDWKVRPNLTLNLGVRWETMGGYTERHNRQVYSFDAHDVNPINGLVNTSGLPINGSLLGGIIFAGVNGNPHSPFRSVYYDFGPRAGFAYTLDAKTVLRGGMGLYFNDDANGGSGSAFTPPQTGYSSTTTYTGSTDGGRTPLQNLSNPFPVLQTPAGNCGGNQLQCLETNAGQSLTFINSNFYPALYLQSSFGIERQFSAQDTLEISYTAARGYDTQYSDDLNHVSAAAQAACDPERGGPESNCTGGASTGTGGYIANPFKGLAPFAASGNYYTASTIQRINFTRPYPIFTSITESNLNGGKYWYNGLEVTYDHRTSFGLTLHGTYTYSKAISATGYADTVNRVRSRVIAGTDIPHRMTISGIYELPVARGRGFFPNMNRVVDAVVGGWQVASIFTYQSGFPFNISGYELNRSANGGYILPRKRFWPGQTNPYWSGKYASSNSYVQAFKPCVGTRDPNSGTVTLEAYSAAAGCGQANFVQLLSGYSVTPNIVYSGIRLQRIVDDDANVSKNFKIFERMSFQLRMDAFNVFNHVIQNSSGYDTTVGDQNFGTYQMGTSGGGNYFNRQIQLSGHLTW
ncbi:MAG TPA: TonB-dependent receptor [Terracidiphilus sp.]|nr:TonB-dependent receptor [Terracidiphilus sp.]